ncbi:MAG: asparagine synthase C-terminal domain-containing protein [Candidatus Nanoarchaeia archaeon]|nr:asparagine synthase C-terminal domain-containing protein [Candidatus Nanoarchaeia archaeon]
MTKKEWLAYINGLKTNILLKDKTKIKKLLEKELINSVKIPKEKFGILFSGGVDSSTIALIAKKFTNNFVCYTVGFKDSEDIKYAKLVAKKLKLKLKIKILDLKDIEDRIKKLVKILPIIDVVSIGVGLVTYSAMELAKKDKVKIIFTGLGSEEIFAGYQRHKLSKDINKECWIGLKDMYDRDIMRDQAIAKYFKMKIETPFLSKELIKLAMQIPAEYKINEENKLILREVSSKLGLKKFAFRKKKAAQYGSNFIKALDKISKKNGFKYKKEYLQSI